MDDAPHTEDLDLASTTTPEKLAELLRTVHRRADKPSLRTLEARTRHEKTPLSKTAVSEMLKGVRFPRKAVMVAFLRACGVQDDHIDPWRRAWERIAAPEPGPTTQHETAYTAHGGQAQLAAGGAERFRAPLQEAAIATRQAATGADKPTKLSTALETTETARLGEQNDELNADNSRPRVEPTAPAAKVRAARSPTVRRRELGILLRALRDQKGLTVEQVAERLLCSTSKVSRIEKGHSAATPRDIRDFCDLYGITDKDERHRLMSLTQEARQRGWWQSYDLDFSTYVGLEADAIGVKYFQCMIVPGLLQTADYARAMLEVSMPKLTPQRIDELIDVKLTRQHILGREDPLLLWAVMDEAALHRVVGSPTVMAAQMDHLIEVARHPNVIVQVIPYHAGAHPAMDSTFNILDFVNVPSVVYVEGLVGWIYMDRPVEIIRYREVFEYLCNLALSSEDSSELVAKVGKEHKRA